MLAASDDDRLLLIPGPTPVARSILQALARPTISHASPELAQEFRSALMNLRLVADNPAGEVFVFSGSGTLAQEAAIINFVEPSDQLLVASNGFFADRMADVARSHELPVHVLQARWGTSISPDALRRSIQEHGATVVAFTHVETSTGAMAPLADFVSIIRDEGALSIVDGVAGLGGVPEEMSRLGIDVLLSGAQKALGVPPGLAIIGVGEQAWGKRMARSSPVRTYFADLARWQPVMQQPDKYFSTHPVNLIYALARGLEIVIGEGLEQRYERHRALARCFRSGMSDLGFTPFTDHAFLSPTLSVFRTPTGVGSTQLRTRLRQAGVVAASGIADTADRIVRFGHMGNVTMAEMAVALEAVGTSLSDAEL
jgi:alanine-glyoxylate transaminase / serine-glyoxylate transaminase / serine-pyruvate transaminase